MSSRGLRAAASIVLPAFLLLAACGTHEQSIDANVRNADGSTPLQWAVMR
jgi:hypothetical protein